MRQLKIRSQITNRKESSSFEKYLSDIAKYEKLTVEEEVDLFKKLELLNPEHKWYEQINELDLETQIKIKKIVDRISEANLRFVVSVAKQYQQFGIPLTDLINEWNGWMLKAIYRYDYTRWFKFISYAVWWIRQSILKYISECSTIKRPMNQENIRRKIEKYIDKYQQEHDYLLPSEDEIKHDLHIKDTEYETYIESTKATLSVEHLDKSINHDTDNTLYDTIENKNIESPDYNIEENTTKQAILSALDSDLKKPNNPWKPDPKKILYLYYYENKTLEEIAECFDVSRERVRQIRDKALKTLRNNKTLQDLHNTLNE